MKTLIGIILLGVVMVVSIGYCESKKDPYQVGMHSTYNIVCENGFIYKVLDMRRGTIQIFNSDGTPLKCGHKLY